MNLFDLFEDKNREKNSGESELTVATSDRMERILRQLRVRNPGARNDLEALLYDFDKSQKKDRQDISRLSRENETAEETIDRIQQELDNLKSEQGMTNEEFASSSQRSPAKNVAIEIDGRIWKIIRGESDFSPIAMDRAEKIADTIKKNQRKSSGTSPIVKVYLTSKNPT